MNDSCNVNLEANKNNQNEKITEKNEENKNVNSNEKLAPKLSRKNLIKGPYILGEVIGEGNFGTVRLATQIKIGEKLAIKIINKNNITKKSDIVRIKKEISILKKIRHKNIIQIYEVMESNQNVYIAMENCEGKELFEYIIKNKRLKELEACRLFRQLINGVDYIHSQGIIHRDLKPENILLDENMDIKISDFGLSTFFTQGEYLSTPCGTPNYAPPEMLIGQQYDGELSDIWSCGIILYTMLTGSLPCAESKETIILNKIVSNQYIIPSYLSKGAIDLLSCMLEPDYLKRIKIKDIMKHPWFNKAKNQLTPGIDIKNNEHTPIDESILKKMLQYGYNIDECRDNLQHMKNNSLTTVYYLLLKKFIHNKGQSIADLKSPSFLEYMAKNSCSEGTNNYIQNTRLVSEDNAKKKNFENILLNDGLNKSCFSNNTLGKSKNFEMNTKLAKHAKKKSEDISNLSLQLKKFNFNKDISLSKSKNKNKTKANLNNNTFNSHCNYEDNNFLTQNQFLYTNNLKTNNKINSAVNGNKDKKIFYKKKKTPDIKKIKIIDTKNNQNKKSNKKIGVKTKLSANNVKKLKSPTLTKKIKNNFIDSNIYNNQTNNKTNNSNFHSINLTESMTIPNNALNLLSSSINVNNTNNEKDKNNNKLKSISPKQKSIIKNKEEISKNENNKKDEKDNENKKDDDQNNNISVIKMIANKIINYKINSSFDAPENIKQKKNYQSVIQRDEPTKTHELYFSQQAYQEHQDHQDNNIRKNITTERIFTETKKKKSQNENVVLDKSDSPVNYSIEKLISSNRVGKKNIKQKNTSTKNNVVKNNNKSNNKNYNNRYDSSKNIDLKNLKISERNSISPKKKENKELSNNLNLNNVNNNNESVIFEDEKSEVESKDSKKVKNYISGNKLIIQIAKTDNNGEKTDSKSKIKTENKQINKSHFNNGNYSSKNVVNDSIKDFKLSNNDKNNIYINKFSKRYISPISQNRGTLKKQNIEKNISVKKPFKSKDKNKDKEKEKDFFIDNNKKYETYTNRAGKLKGNKTTNGNFTNINSNNKNKEISNSKKNIYLTKTYNTNLNQNSNANKKNNNDNNNNSNTLNKKKNFSKICHTRTGSGSDSVSFFSKIKVISNKISNRRRQKEQIPEESGLHIKHLTSGNILTEYKNKTNNKSFNNNTRENNFYLDSIVKNYSITGLIDKINNFLKKEKCNITKQVNPNLHVLKCSKEGGLIFHIEIIPLTSKNNDVFYLKKIFDKGDVKIFNELISNLQKNI